MKKKSDIHFKVDKGNRKSKSSFSMNGELEA